MDHFARCFSEAQSVINRTYSATANLTPRLRAGRFAFCVQYHGAEDRLPSAAIARGASVIYCSLPTHPHAPAQTSKYAFGYSDLRWLGFALDRFLHRHEIATLAACDTAYASNLINISERQGTQLPSCPRSGGEFFHHESSGAARQEFVGAAKCFAASARPAGTPAPSA